MVAVALREDVRAVVAGDEEEEGRLGRLEHRAHGLASGTCDRARRQALDLVGVVGVVRILEMDAAEVAVEVGDPVDHGRIGLEPHAALHPIEEDGGDEWPFLGDPRLLLDDRSERHHLAHRELALRRAGPEGSVDLTEFVDHRLGDLRRGQSLRETIGVGEEVALESRALDLESPGDFRVEDHAKKLLAVG